MKFSPAVALLLASDAAKAINMKEQKPTKTLAQKESPAHALNQVHVKKEAANPQITKSLLQAQQIIVGESGGSSTHLAYSQSNFDANALSYKPIPENYDMGPNPEWLILFDKETDVVPEGFYLPDVAFVNEHKEALTTYMDNSMPPNDSQWAVFAFNGGVIKGWGYDYEIVCEKGCPDDPLYDVFKNPDVSDVIIVKADPDHPNCLHPGYDCTCEKKPSVDPFSRKPLPCDDGYTLYPRNQVSEWEAAKATYGFDDGWDALPNGYIGDSIDLGNWKIFDGAEWEEWRFGFEITDELGNVQEGWDAVAGVAFTNNEGEVKYEYIVKIPDSPQVMVDDRYCFLLYNQNEAGNQCTGPFNAPRMQQRCFDIGKPFMPFEDEEDEIAIIKAIWTFADHDNDQCVSYDEMIAMLDWGTKDAEYYAGLVDAFFEGDNNSQDGYLTWSEFNDWVAGLTELDGQMMEPQEKDALRTFFKFFDQKAGNEDYVVTRDEAMSGILTLAEKIGYFYPEFNYYWSFFNVDDDECIYLHELEETIREAYDVTEPEINYYWIKYYWEKYSVTEYYWWIYRLPNGGFDFDGYYTHIPDGPAFGGAEWLYFDEYTGYTQTVYMWHVSSECFFSLNFVGNSAPGESGECTITGHESIGGAHDVSEIILYFYSNPTHAVKFLLDVEEWGPVEYMTDERYYSSEGIWIWMKPDFHCDVCDDVADWSVINFNAQSTDFTYGYDTETIGYNDDVAGGGLYQTGEGYKNEDDFAVAGVDEDGNMIVAPDVYPDGVIDDTMYGVDEDGNMIVAPEYMEDYYTETVYYDMADVYYESFSYSEIADVQYESFSYSEVSSETGMETLQVACSNDLFQDANGGCDFYESSMLNAGDEALICPMSVDFALMDGITAQACCDVCAGF